MTKPQFPKQSCFLSYFHNVHVMIFFLLLFLLMSLSSLWDRAKFRNRWRMLPTNVRADWNSFSFGAEIKGVPLLIVPSGKTACLLRSQIYLGDIWFYVQENRFLNVLWLNCSFWALQDSSQSAEYEQISKCAAQPGAWKEPLVWRLKRANHCWEWNGSAFIYEKREVVLNRS